MNLPESATVGAEPVDVVIAPTPAQYRQFAEDLEALRERGAESNTAAILAAVRTAANDAAAPLLRPTDVTRMLNVSRAWTYAAAKNGQIPHIRLGDHPKAPLRFVRADIEAWLEDARQAWRPGDSSAETLRRAASPGRNRPMSDEWGREVGHTGR